MSMDTIPDGQVPPALNLEQQKKRARELVRAHREGNLDAARRIGAHAPKFRDASDEEILGSTVLLSTAQLVVARENGFRSWTAMKRAIEARDADSAHRAEMLIAATRAGDFRGAESLLAADPALARASIHVAAALGEVETVEGMLRRDPAAASAHGGPYGWPPLLYLCFSRYLRSDSPRSRRMVRIAKLLLEAGADPNAFYTSDEDPEHPQTALYGAAGIANNAELTRLLLEAGADPNDGDPGMGPESLYHASEFDDTACLKLILDAGPDRDKISYCLARKLDFEDPEGTRLYLEAGADPNFRTPWAANETRLHKALRNRRSPEVVGLLLEYGADPDARSAEGITPYALAVRMGEDESADLLRRAGASEEDARQFDRFLGACSRADRRAVDAMLSERPDLVRSLASRDRRTFPDAARFGRTDAVRLMLDVGFPIGEPGDEGMTALHWAAWFGHVETVSVLLERGAPLEARNHYGGTVLWSMLYRIAEHGARIPDIGPYVEIAERLITAGALPGHWAEQRTGREELDRVLDGAFGPAS